MIKRTTIKNILLATFWIALGCATIFLLVAAIKTKGAQQCKGVEINIHGVSNNFFVDKNDILHVITSLEKTNPVGKAIGRFNLKNLEAEMEKNVWVKSAELFFDNNENLQVVVQEREPIARVFTSTGTTFYIDEELAILPLSEKFSARLPVFTNFSADKNGFTKADSSLLMNIKTISLAIQKDSFSMAMVEQIDITAQQSFEMIPKMGNQLIVFGDATDVDAKLGKLKMFYKDIMVKAGWDTYSVINVAYKNQVVAKRKGAEDIAADSLRSLQIMQMIADRAQKAASDSLQISQLDNDRNTVDSTMIQQSIQRDDNEESPVITNAMPDQPVGQSKQVVLLKIKPANMKQDLKPVLKKVQKPVQEKNAANVPKAVLPKKNDY